MIQPNMATMLGYVATDAKIRQALLQECLAHAAELSFNRITVDGDTSTNDACVLLASGCSDAPEILANSPEYAVFSQAIINICKRLAELIIRDGEGATKMMRIVVEQAQTRQEAVQVAKTIAHSPLVKTAFFASDPNWGRILAAVGRAGVENMQLDKIEIYLGTVCIVENGGRSPGYTEQDGQRVMDQAEITITVRLGRGDSCEEVLTCDFSYDYVRINAEYRS
jgi:glutamate N-acetyltransferase/amino-acid N-acetyltransferase